MSKTEEIYLNPLPLGRVVWFPRLRPIVRKLLRLPGLRHLRPIAHQAAAVAIPAGRLTFKPHPTRTTRSNNNELTILSANLWHDWPRHRRLQQRLESVARLIETEDVDVVLLQEVARTPDLHADSWLAERLGMAYVYSRANGHETAVGFEEGLAVYSRFPLTAPTLRQLGTSSNPFTRRLALGAKVETPSGSLPIFSVHLSLTRRENARQLAHLRQWVATVAGKDSALIGGDFNACEKTSQIAQAQRTWLDAFRHLHPTAGGVTHELRWPWGNTLRRQRLDYLFLRQGNRRWQVLDARHVDAPGGPHSDHRAVLVKLKDEEPALSQPKG